MKKPIDVILEQYNIDREDDDVKIVKDFDNVISWFDYMPQGLKDFFAQNPYGVNSFKKAMVATMSFLGRRYDLKRVVVKDKEEIVGMLIYSYTDKDFEDIDNDEVEDETKYPIVLAAAVHPNYRQKGLLKMMISQAPVQHPFLVQTSQISTPEVWAKLGCKLVQDLSAKYGEGNAVEMCNENIIKESAGKLLTIIDLAEILANIYDDKELIPLFKKELSNSYKHSGDEGVVHTFSIGTNMIITPVSHGKYYFR